MEYVRVRVPRLHRARTASALTERRLMMTKWWLADRMVSGQAET